MKHPFIVAAALATLAPGAAAADQTAGSPAQAAQATRIELPSGATLVATAEVDQIRAFPEQQAGKGKPPPECATVAPPS